MMEGSDQELTGRSLQDFLQNELTTLSSNLDDTYTVLSQKWIGNELMVHLDKLQQTQQGKVTHYHTLEDHIQKLTELRQKLRILTAQTQSAKQQQEKLNLEISNSQQDIEIRREALKGNSHDTEQSLKELELAASFYRDRLGLRFQKISGGRLQYCFSSLDRENPETCCYFCLKINDDRTYAVSEFSPPLDNMEELETKLNMTNNLRSFMVAIRKKFIKALNSPK
ncbi:kinetochore protein Spc25-like [Ostrea edulis]|uniref:kinetochore protein Spc25-like n=1 Tax=Ostrea edulis TaxID=37623 RepID=UPI002094786F|nr:kinetochore protein Spc25-like [Ostrea edulis]